MKNLVITDTQGNVRSVAAQNGLSVMEVIRPLGLGLAGECEGSLACATCHVWIDQQWLELLAPPSDAEAEMLDCIFNARPTSRLSCQLMVEACPDDLAIVIASTSA